MSGPWRVCPVYGIEAWLVSRPTIAERSVYAKRRPASGNRSALWPTREAAERAAARLNRKYGHECPGLYDCDPHPVPAVVHSRLRPGPGKEAWLPTPKWAWYRTRSKAFAVALEHAKEDQP